MYRMTPEDFAAYVREVIRTEIYVGPITCGCCGTGDIEGIEDAVKQITERFAAYDS